VKIFSSGLGDFIVERVRALEEILLNFSCEDS
jgi:hypothetical protein